MNNEPTKLPRDQMFDRPWVFLKEADTSGVILAINVGGLLQPVFLFSKPSTLIEFSKDAKKAIAQFVPLPVRQAIDIADRWDINGDKGDEPPDDPSSEEQQLELL